MVYRNVLCAIRSESLVHQLAVVIITKAHFYYLFFVLFNNVFLAHVLCNKKCVG